MVARVWMSAFWRVTFCAALTLFAASAMASDWVIIKAGIHGAQVSLDRLSIRDSGPLRKAWFKTEYDLDQRLPSDVVLYDSGPRQFAAVKELRTFSCSEHSSALVKVIYYNADEAVIASKSVVPSDVALDSAASRFLVDAMLQAVCAFNFESAGRR
jgi:hypothetical protein